MACPIRRYLADTIVAVKRPESGLSASSARKDDWFDSPGRVTQTKCLDVSMTVEEAGRPCLRRSSSWGASVSDVAPENAVSHSGGACKVDLSTRV